MPYETEKPNTGRLIGIGLVATLHVALIYALANGLAQSVVDAVKGPIEVKIIDTPPEIEELEPPPPSPPPPALDEPPPPYVPLPEVQINTPTPDSKAITAVQSVEKVSGGTRPRSDPAHPNRHPEYPIASRRMEEEGTVILSLFVSVD
ncbi:MAG: hypothetical protein K9G30_08855, partial [Parvibaculum sp.]|nr:hypothetical protein [Parvibaculum sp.]